MRKLNFGVAALLSASLVIALPSAISAKGKLTKREPPATPAVDANKCIITGPVIISGISSFRIKNRAENRAIERWESFVRRKYGPSFAKWSNTSRYQEREIKCRENDRAIGKTWTCQAVGVPCQG